ncbi:hypothetical protein AAG570_013407 [Ranatra chinensis]|uniref:Uncharacterized protein n=1 Tax=Ranatra chinensis TaxID=642074 RepID=A0ABD0YYH3_9HEMI
MKRLVREFQSRETELLNRDEFYQQMLQEKDTEYNALVKALKDRVIQVEEELLETQRRAGLPVHLPHHHHHQDSGSGGGRVATTPPLARRHIHQHLPNTQVRNKKINTRIWYFENTYINSK